MPRPQYARLRTPDRVTATCGELSALSLARGDEQPVRSPALELQEVLEEMLARPVAHPPKAASAFALTLGLITVAGVCGVFWIGLARALISLA